jgi:hypothetical protein
MKATIDFDEQLYRRLKIEQRGAAWAARALLALLGDSQVRPTGASRAVLSDVIGQRRSALRAELIDRLILADYRRNMPGIVTFDRALGKLPGTELLD